MKILGIDPGFARCGYGLINKQNNSYSLIEFGCITTSSTQSNSQRLNTLKIELDGIIKKHKPDIVGVEQLFYFNNQKTVIQVAQARGVILLALEEAGIKLKELTPLQIKMGLTGYGKADKAQIQKMVKMLLKLVQIPKPDDAADALAIALTVV